MQITNETLIVGLDVASETHFARAFDYRGIELGKLIKFSNDAYGFRLLKVWISELNELRSGSGRVLGQLKLIS